MPEAGFPNLLYVGDVSVEASHHGSALLYRLLEAYPVDRLWIVETGEPSRAERRLPGVRYSSVPIGSRRWLNTRLHGLYSAWLLFTAPETRGRLRTIISEFRPTAVVTVGHGHGWLLAAELARQLRLPLHVVVHDDWPRLSGILPVFRGWLERRFAKVCRDAHTCLCVSPFMAEEYGRRYGVAAAVLYPSRSHACPVLEVKPPRVIPEADEIVVGYGGNSEPGIMACLRDLAGALATARARAVVFGPFGDADRQELLSISSSFTFHGLVSYQEMIAQLRCQADVLVVPMAFAAALRDNMVVSFPSKLADYTAVGLPLLVYGPPYSSAVRWAQLHAPVAEVVDAAGPAGLALAIRRLRGDAGRRLLLAERALEVGVACFASAAGREKFYAALGVPGGKASTMGAITG